MKHLMCCILVLSCLFCCFGCSADETGSVNFYYVRDTYQYGQEDGVMVAEIRDTTEFSDAQAVMNAYLDGPQDATLHSPFPSGTTILEFLIETETLRITLSSHVAALSKIDQVLACACFARTAMELMGVNAVRFESNSTDFTKMDPILIDRGSILLYDNYQPIAPTETQ